MIIFISTLVSSCNLWVNEHLKKIIVVRYCSTNSQNFCRNGWIYILEGMLLYLYGNLTMKKLIVSFFNGSLSRKLFFFDCDV